MFGFKPIHPFPARMAASVALAELRSTNGPLRVLDPMAGSGTTLVLAKAQGHRAIGFDTDPLAVLLANAWCSERDEQTIRNTASIALKRAIRACNSLAFRNAYPCAADDTKTRQFVRYWFNPVNRRQLTALSREITATDDDLARTLLWCAFSRMIISKQASVSLAMDISHSRPHKVTTCSSFRPFDKFAAAVEFVLAATSRTSQGSALAKEGDARCLPLKSATIDLVITSPPYLNAIDYMRAHKFSLVWMSHSIQKLRTIRSSNIGTEVGYGLEIPAHIETIVEEMAKPKNLPSSIKGMLIRYANDMDKVMSEIWRVLRPNGRATLVVGNSTLRGVYLENSWALCRLAKLHGFRVSSVQSRVLPDNRRYLPPPASAHHSLSRRMRKEVVIKLRRED